MNKRIEELAKQIWPDPTISHINHIKFAQLIASECISLVNLRQKFAVEDELNAEHALDILVYDIEQHFGITHE